MKYGMNLLLWAADVEPSHDPVLEQIKQIGFDGVEVPVFDFDVPKFERLGAKLDELGLGRTAVTVSTAEANPISESAAVRQAAVDRLKQAVDCCQAAGATHLCGPLHSALGEFTGKGPTPDERQWAKETLRPVGDYAQQAGVTLVLEYLNRFECYFLNCAADAVQFVSDIDHPNIKLMYDTFHAHIEEKDVAGAIRTCADQLVHVHISENDRSTPGEGAVNWDATFATLKEIGYDGWMVVEAFGLALPDLAAATCIWRRMFPSEEHVARQALNFMKSRWEG